MLLPLGAFCSSMLVFGGFDGQLLSDVVKIQFCEFVSSHTPMCTLGCKQML